MKLVLRMQIEELLYRNAKKRRTESVDGWCHICKKKVKTLPKMDTLMGICSECSVVLR